MWTWLLVTLGLITSAVAAENVDNPAAEPVFEAPLTAGPFKNPVDAAEEAIEKEKTEAEKRAEERVKALEAAASKQAARVVVLEWQGFPETNYENETLIRNIKVRIARPDAKFYPEIDLYQAGRKEPDKSLLPEEQRAIVPDETIPYIESQIAQVESIPWNGLSEQEWGLKARDLRDLAQEIWFVDREDLQEPLFRLYCQIGNAAENQNNPVPPFYEQVGGQTVNYYWYLAAALAYEDPALLDSVTNPDIKGAVEYLKDLLDTGVIPPMTLSFENAGNWEPKKFATDYEVYINGLPVIIDDPKGLYPAPPGRVDVYLKRSDGHSLSDRIELDKLDEKIYGVRDTARQRMGVDFIQQLMEHPNECVPQVDGDILTYLAIYAKLHPDAEIYIAIPEAGSPNRIYLWRWVRFSGTLQKVTDDTGGFPVRFVALLGGGMVFSGLTEPEQSAEEKLADLQSTAENNASTPPEDVTDVTGGANVDPTSLIPEFKPAGIPIKYHMRGHYGRFMFTFGMEYTVSISGQPWFDEYQIDKDHQDYYPVETSTADNPFCTAQQIHERTDIPESDVGDGEFQECYDEYGGETVTLSSRLMRERDWQRLVMFGLGAVLMQDAAIGFGPYGFIRTGWYNAPHAIDLTANLGYAAEAPFSAKSGRVRPMVDAGVFGGVMLPFAQSRLHDSGVFGKPLPTFGATVGAGLTF